MDCKTLLPLATLFAAISCFSPAVSAQEDACQPSGGMRTGKSRGPGSDTGNGLDYRQ